MMSSSASSLVHSIWRKLKVELPPESEIALESVQRFLRTHEPEPSSVRETVITHFVIENYPDWWEPRTYKLSIGEDSTLEKLHRHIAEMYSLGVPLTLAEKPSKVIRFFQDIEIWGTKDVAFEAQELLASRSAFWRVVGKAMGAMFPGDKLLDCFVFTSIGTCRKKDVKKTHIRLVWPHVFVARTKAEHAHDYIVHQFQESQDSEIMALEEKMQRASEAVETDKSGGRLVVNEWGVIFNADVYSGNILIRMPYCDEVSPAPVKRPEKRPFKPHSVIRCNFTESRDLESVEPICGADALSQGEWLSLGIIRTEDGKEQTEWRQPAWTGRRGGPAQAGSRAPGQLKKTRTEGGSPGDNPYKAARSARCGKTKGGASSKSASAGTGNFKDAGKGKGKGKGDGKGQGVKKDEGGSKSLFQRLLGS